MDFLQQGRSKSFSDSFLAEEKHQKSARQVKLCNKAQTFDRNAESVSNDCAVSRLLWWNKCSQLNDLNTQNIQCNQVALH